MTNSIDCLYEWPFASRIDTIRRVLCTSIAWARIEYGLPERWPEDAAGLYPKVQDAMLADFHETFN